MNIIERAKMLRPIIEQAAQSLDDATALQSKELYPRWEELVKKGSVDTDGEPGYRFFYGGDLYHCRNDNPTFAQEWIPGVGTESLYERIDETHDGTFDDPIPYSGNMALEAGKYYSQDGVIYLCTRDTVNPVYNALADLVGLYVELA